MTFKDFYLLQERDDYDMSSVSYNIAKSWVEDLMNWLQDINDVPENTDPKQFAQMLLPYYKKIKYIHTMNSKVPVFFKERNDPKDLTKGAAAFHEEDWSSNSITVVDRQLSQKKDVMESLYKDVPKYQQAARNFYAELYTQKDSLTNLIGHELAHMFRMEKDIVGDKDQEKLEETKLNWLKTHGYVQDPVTKQWYYVEEKDLLKKKYIKELKKLYDEKKSQTPWYSFLKSMNLKDDYQYRLDNAKYGTYANEFDEIDARFLEALFPTLRKDYPTFRELEDDFYNTIAADYWSQLLPKQKQRIKKRLYQYWDSKKK